MSGSSFAPCMVQAERQRPAAAEARMESQPCELALVPRGLYVDPVDLDPVLDPCELKADTRLRGAHIRHPRGSGPGLHLRVRPEHEPHRSRNLLRHLGRDGHANDRMTRAGSLTTSAGDTRAF